MKSLLARFTAFLPPCLRKPSEHPLVDVGAAPIPRRQLFACDCDEEGLYVRLIHTTSSANLVSIEQEGLRPLRVSTEVLKQYLLRIAPDKELAIKRVLSVWTAEHFDISSRCADTHLLVRLRFGHGNKIYFLPLLGSHDYLGSAAENGTLDGGEIFAAARKALACDSNLSLQPLYPDATQMVVIATFRLVSESAMRWVIQDMDSFAINILPGGAVTGLKGGSTEIATTVPVAADHLECMSIDEFKATHVEEISACARAELLAATRSAHLNPPA